MIHKKTICPLDCPDSCAMIATVVDGRVTSLKGDIRHPYTRGFICRKMRRYPERLYGPDRVLYPQLRVGAKGQGRFKRIGWDEALDLMAGRLADIRERYGGEAILPYSYAGNMGAVNRFAGYPLFHRLGASQLDQTICSAAASAGWSRQLGNTPGCPPENAADADLIVAWGIDIKVTNSHFWPYVAAARKKGGKFVVIDPCCNDTARAADSHLAVLPGGDLALALGVLKALVECDLLDRRYIDEETEGFASLEEELRCQDWVSLTQESGLSRQAMEKLAGLLARSPRTFLRIGIGLSRNSRGGMAVRAITALAGALGLFGGGPGRGVLMTSGAFRGDKARLTWPSLAPAATRTVNMIDLGHALTAQQPPVRALFVYNANPLGASPDSAMVRRGLAREDLFTVVHEQVLTPTARYADLLLPATTFLENHDVYTAYGHFYMGVAQPVIEPYAEARSNFQLFQELALRMGFTDQPFYQSCAERIADYLRGMEGIPEGCTITEILNGRLVHSSNSCRDGRVLVNGRGRFSFAAGLEGGEPDVPRLTPQGEFADLELLARFPFRLITPPHPDLLNTTFGERYPGRKGELQIHPDDAVRWEVGDGEEVTIYNRRGRVTRIARITSDTRQGVLVAPGLFWPVDGSGSTINDLTSQRHTDIGGGATFHETLVAIGGKGLKPGQIKGKK